MLFRGIFALALVAAALPASAIETVDELLQKASVAVQERNYQGRYTYEAGSGLESLEIVHAVVNGIEKEKVFHLNGEEREFLRDGRPSDCVSTGNFLLRGGLMSVGGATVSLSQNYHFYIRGDERIAGRNASVVQIIPRDEYRYGLTLAIDKSTFLPLMSLTTSNKSVLERFQAVEILLDGFDVESALNPNGVVGSIDGSKHPCAKPEKGAIAWQPQWVPRGFVLSHNSVNEAMGESLTYTDGIASFTLFVKPQDASKVKQGAARRGATTAYLGAFGSQTQVFQVVLIGEVPVGAAQQIVSSVAWSP